MINDGMNKLDYSFGNDEELNSRLSKMLNDLCHVFRHHPDGNWKRVYKPKYAEMIAVEFSERPSLIRKLLALGDPVVSNVTYVAIELTKSFSPNIEKP